MKRAREASPMASPVASPVAPPVTSPQLPNGFVESLAPLLGEETQDFLRSYEAPWVRGIRLNPMKRPQGDLNALVEGIGDAIPWEPMGRYLSQESAAGAHSLHEGGAYYLQEPSAMAPAAALNPKPGERVLDLCAAPGGKSTQMALQLGGRGVLVCNEPVPARAQVLSRNVERMGVPNAVVVCALPEKLAALWPECFDKILVDAPCSGEGMFRRHPQARLEWTPQSPEGCRKRQLEILNQAARMLAPGGRMCYSTCTLNQTENEGVVEAFMKEHPEWSLVPIALPGLAGGQGGMARLFPHRIRGEGHFAALLERKGVGKKAAVMGNGGLAEPGREALRALEAFMPECPKIPQAMLGDTLAVLPEGTPCLRGIKLLRAGLHLGVVRGKLFFPDHAWAAGWEPPAPAHPVTLEQAARYLRGETLPAEQGERGWRVVTLEGVPLGWGKASQGTLKNHYPKGLRR